MPGEKSGTTAFDGLAERYAQARPDYPAEVVGAVAAAIDAVSSPADARERLVLDVGAGTGIGTRAIAGALRQPARVIGVEPGEDMRRQAQLTTDLPNVAFVTGQAERLPTADSSAVGVFVAQAVHWFDRPAFYSEVKRVLVSGGVLAIMQNNRAWSRSALVDGYEQLLERHSPGYTRTYRDFDIAAELAADGGFAACERLVVPWERTMEPERFVTMTRSSSRMEAVVDRYGADAAERMVRELVAQQLPAGVSELVVSFDAELFLARTV